MSLFPLSPPFLGLSFRDSTIFLSFYVLSLPVYHHSTLLPSSPFYRTYFTFIRRLLAPRHWIQAFQRPGIVTYLRLGILHCPHIHLSSLLGYCLRCYGEPIALWLCYVTPTLPPMPAQLRKGLSTVRRLLLAANSYNSEPFIYPLQRHLHNDHSPYKLSRLILSHVKLHLRQQLFCNARIFFVNVLVRLIGLFFFFVYLGGPSWNPYKSYPPFCPSCHPSLDYWLWTWCPFPSSTALY